jgi:phosphate transport system substrate-binding protein
VGGLRVVGSELKNAVEQLALGFEKFQPDAKVSTSNIPSSEGGIAGLYYHISDVAPMGDDAKITDMMPFHDSFGYMPTEISVATGGYEKRGSLWAFAVVVSKDNPLNEISVDELERIFGAERSGGWELVNNDYLFTSRYARGPETNLRKWGQVGLKGAFASKEIETFGYSAPGFAIYFTPCGRCSRLSTCPRLARLAACTRLSWAVRRAAVCCRTNSSSSSRLRWRSRAVRMR